MKQKNPNAVALGRLGGKRRAESLSQEERTRIARKASRAAKAKITPEQRREWGRAGAKIRWQDKS